MQYIEITDESTSAPTISEKKALQTLKKGYNNAKKLLNDKDKVEEFLQKLERKIKVIPHVGGTLANVPLMASLINSYVHKEYTEVPIGTIIAVLSALVYFLSHIDLIPDTIPVVGLLDDATVVSVCLKLVESDLKDYAKWREEK